jgi:hypothetical protein
MKHRFLIICIAAFVFSGCVPPIGSIYGDGNGNGNGNGNGANSGFDTLWVIPNRLFYERGDIFDTAKDLQIFTSDKGLVRQVSPDEPDLTITISESSSFGDPRNPVVLGPDPYVFPLPGIYFIEIAYNDKTARYTIEVKGYFVPPGEGSDFVDIIWL